MSNEKTINETPIVETTIEPKDGKIGTMLHDIRIKKKLTLEDISKALRIKISYLTAIEESDYDNIPSDPYGIGFIRSYASYLGLNSMRITQLFKEETKQENHLVPETKPSVKENLSDETADESNNIYIPNQKYIIISIIMLLLVYAVWQISSSKETAIDMTTETVLEDDEQNYPIQVENYNLDNEENGIAEKIQQINISEDIFNEAEVAKETSEKENIPTTEKNSKESTESPKVENTPTIASPKKTGRVVLKVKKETWIEVKDDDKLWISKVLKAGDEYILPDNGEGKTVSFGNTDGVDVVIDGKVVTIVSNNKKTNIKMDAFLGNH